MKLQSSLLLASIALLAACGAGDGDGPDASPADPALKQALMAYCEIDEDPRSPDADGGYSYWPAAFSWGNRTGKRGSSLYAWGDNSDYTQTLPMLTEYRDHRELSTGYYADIGAADYRFGMGMTIADVFSDGAVACVRAVSRLQEAPRRPGEAAGSISPRTLAWRSYFGDPLELVHLPGVPVDGFEFPANFVAADATAWFGVRKSDLGRIDGVQICHRGTASSNWECALPTVSDEGDGWNLSIPAGAPGVYMLVSPLAARGA